MPLVKAGQIVEDRFVRLIDDAAAPDDVAVLVPAKRFVADSAEFASRAAATGVIWPNDRDVAELAPHLDRLAAVALVFPSFRDGRAYSQARLLRERYRFGGELRATGQVLRDQFVLLVRAGFDAFEVSKEADARAFSATLARSSAFYQPVGTDATPVLQRRRTARRIADHVGSEPTS